MTWGHERKSISFQEIKARLDPCCVYMIFEKAAGVGGPFEFQEIKALLDPYRELILGQDLHHDAASSRLFLVIKLDPAQAQGAQEMLLHPGLPRDVVVYWYGNLPLEGGAKDMDE